MQSGIRVDTTQSRISAFILDTFPPAGDEADYAPTQSLLDTGVIDSIGVLTVVTWLEQEFGITVDDEDVVPENLDSIASLTAYVDGKLAASGE